MSELDKKNNSSGALTEANLAGGASLTSAMHTGLGLESPFMREICLKRQVIVGTRFQGGSDELVEDLKKGSKITFLREPDNRFDPNAIMALDDQGRKLGYIPRRENELMGALMAAGKYFYGVITDPPAMEEDSDTKTPYSIWTDLYMREFARPDDLNEIPLQGYRGSYVVADFSFADIGGRLYLTGFFAIRYIRGEERASLGKELTRREITDTTADREMSDAAIDEQMPDGTLDREGQESMIREFAHFAGHLPLVTFDIRGRKQECLEETYDTVLGTIFSNRIIDTRQMAHHHMPVMKALNVDADLKNYWSYLGMDIHYDNPLEQRCRRIWQLYCKMETSDLKSKNRIDRETTPYTGYSARSLLLSKLKIREGLRNILYRNNIDMIWELTAHSRSEVRSFKYMDKWTLEELDDILENLDTGFRPEEADPYLYAYPDYVKEIPEERLEGWQYLLFMEIYSYRYEWLLPLRKRHMKPTVAGIAVSKVDNPIALKEIINRSINTISKYAGTLSDILRGKVSLAFGDADHKPDPLLINEMAEGFTDLYKKVILWIEEIRSYEADPSYQKAIDLCAQIGEELCSFYDRLYEEYDEGIRLIKDYQSGFISAEEMNAAVRFNHRLPMDAITRLVEVLKKELYTM